MENLKTVSDAISFDTQQSIQECFESFVSDFSTEIDFYFKTYNRNLKENIEIQIKGTKKEKLKYIQFLTHEERIYWKDYPRKQKFYHEGLRKLFEIYQKIKHKDQQKQQQQEVRDLSLIITSILNIMPMASQKYCKKIGIKLLFHQDQENKVTFDSVTESLKMFDADDLKNWKILGATMTLLASDTIQIFLGQAIQNDIQLSAGVIDILLDICKYYSIYQPFAQQDKNKFILDREDGIEDDTLFDQYFKQIQMVQSKIYSNISKISFDKAMMFLMRSLSQDFTVLKGEEIDQSAQKIYFCRFLSIVPNDKLMASHVQTLLDSINSILISKKVKEDLKNTLYSTLKYLIEQLDFQSEAIDIQYDSPMRILWPFVESLFKSAEKATKKENLRNAAIQAMVVIIKVSPQEFFNDKMNKLMRSIKLMTYFENKKTYNVGLQLINELSQGGQVLFNKFYEWEPKLFTKQCLLIEDYTTRIVTPLSFNYTRLGYKLSRKFSTTEQMPLSFRETFKIVFNSKLFSSCNYYHKTYLIQMAFEDLDYLCSFVIQQLIGQLKTQERLDLVLLALKVSHFIMSPTSAFKSHYMNLHNQTQEQLKFMQDKIEYLRQYISVIIKELLKSQFFKSEFIQDIQNFFKSEEKEFCNDQMALCWSKQFIQRSSMNQLERQISNRLKVNKLGKYHLSDEQIQISFEDFREIQSNFQMGNDNESEYTDEQIMAIQNILEKEYKEWDRKKEMFLRHRIMCYLTEERKDGQRQNTSYYQFNSQNNNKLEERKIAILVMKMVSYLPDVHQYFNHLPIKKLLIDDQGSLLNIVTDLTAENDDSGKNILQAFQNIDEIKQGLQENANLPSLKKKKSQSNISQKYTNPKLKEAEFLLPYYILSLCPRISQNASKSLCKMILYGDLKTKISMLDQMVYFIKELMLDTPDDYLICQFIQQLITMIKTWHSIEKTKVKIESNHMKNEPTRLDKYDIINLHPASNESNDSQDLASSQYLFDMMDVITLMGICNKDKLIRQLSIILLVESGKFKRLMINKNQYKSSLYDIFYYQKEELTEDIIAKVLIFNPFKCQEFRSESDLKEVMSEIPLYHFIVDNFDYKKSGLNETLVRDISVILIGKVMQQWKQQIILNTSNSHVYLSYVGTLASRTLTLFENKGEGINIVKDYVGINLLLAITIFNVCRSSSMQQVHSNEENSDSNINQGIIITSTNSIMEELSNLLALLELDFSDVYKTNFGKFYPQRFSISSIILSFLYSLQDPYDKRSIENIKEIFQPERAQSNQSSYFKNCLIFYTLLTKFNSSNFLKYVEKDQNLLLELIQKLDYFAFNDQEKGNEVVRKQKMILFINYLNSIVLTIKHVVSNKSSQQTKKYSEKQKTKIKSFLKSSYQLELLEFTRKEYLKIEENAQTKNELEWLFPKIREIWQTLLSFETIFFDIPNVKLDLKFLIHLESMDYEVLKYYKYLQNNNAFPQQSSKQHGVNIQEDVQQDFTINELKLLYNQIFLFYKPEANYNEQILKKNSYYKCFITNIVGADDLLGFLKQNNFNFVYGQLTSSCLRSNKTLIETKIKKFISYNLHSKYLLLGLFMSLNSMDKKIIERSKILCLSTLPLLFEDEKFRERIESEICEHEDLRKLVAYDNKSFYQFIKKVFQDEEAFNMKNHFEKYFSVSGLLRQVLNEVIKLQTLNFSQRMIVKILDIVTYFISNLQLRRSPQIDSNAFIFDNLIDYKSFEFLSKLYKITDKLIDCDDESIIMNMWYKLIEGGKIQNFEILAKFLVHNLSSYLVKIKETKSQGKKEIEEKQKKQKQTNNGQVLESEYSLDFEKQKRYSLSIFNYIKARTQQMDIRNSINLSAHSVTWSQKMIKLMRRASLNIHSKYVLEKLKLKAILQIMHSEVNQFGIQLKLRGGLHKNIEINDANGKRLSTNMSQLLQSRTFLDIFSAKNRKEYTIMKNLLFRLRKIMAEKFIELTPQAQIDQMPLLTIKYFENSLYTLKEELTVVVVMMVLIIDLSTTEKDENRFYFLLETFNKLSINISTIQQYFVLKMLNLQSFFSKDTKIIDKLWTVINLKNTAEHFDVFTKILFKMMLNFERSSEIQYYLLKLWIKTFQKHKDSLGNSTCSPTMAQTSITELQQFKNYHNSLKYSRKLILTILESSFFKVYEMAQTKREVTTNEFKYAAFIFKQHFQCLMEYVIPGVSALNTQSHLTNGFQSQDSVNVAFAANALFWLSYVSIECSYANKSKTPYSDQLMEIQAIGMQALRKVLEESDFVKMLIGIFKLSPHFYAYSISLTKKQTCLMDMIFDCLENPIATEDAIKSLIITVRVQDNSLLCNENKRELAQVKLQRFILLIPYFMQQFMLILKGSSSDKQPIFNNYKNIISLLKKSLTSIGIDKKKDVFDKLESLQKEAEKNDEKLIKKEFESLIIASIELCQQIGYIQTIFECERIFTSMKQCKSIQTDKLDLAIKLINEFIVTHNLKQQHKEEVLTLNESVYSDEILGEETLSIKKELRPLYFGLKNIILKELDNIDKEIDIQKFFVDPASIEKEDLSLIPASYSKSKSTRRNTFAQKYGAIADTSNNSSEQKGNSYEKSQQKVSMGTFSQEIKNIIGKKQKVSSKYQNSESSSAIKQLKEYTPTDKQGSQSALHYHQKSPQKNQFLQQDLLQIKSKSILQQYEQIELEDDKIHVPAMRSQTSEVVNKKYLVAQQMKMPRSAVKNNEIIFQEENEDQQDLDFDDDQVYIHDDMCAQDEDQFIVHQIEEEQKRKEDSSSNEDPRLKLKQIIESSKKKYIEQNQNFISMTSSPQREQTHVSKVEKSLLQAAKNEQIHSQFKNQATTPKQFENQREVSKKYKNEMDNLMTFSKPQEQKEIKEVVPKQQQQSRPTDIATNPNYVAERTSKIFSDLSQSNKSLGVRMDESQVVMNDNWKTNMQQNQLKKAQVTAKYPWLHQDDNTGLKTQQQSLASLGKVSQDSKFKSAKQQNPYKYQDHQPMHVDTEGLRMKAKATNFLSSMKGEELPTPKKSNKLNSRLIKYINDQGRFIALEKFLTQHKQFDVDFLHFYLNVMEFKQENNQDKVTTFISSSQAKLAAGMIIDKYLTEDAENYISVEGGVVNEVIGDYERSCMRRETLKLNLFDKATYKIESNLVSLVEEFKQQTNEEGHV